MDHRFQENGIEVSVKVWLVCGALFGVVLGMSALDEGSSALSLIVAGCSNAVETKVGLLANLWRAEMRLSVSQEIGLGTH
jgi:hypothetical protein